MPIYLLSVGEFDNAKETLPDISRKRRVSTHLQCDLIDDVTPVKVLSDH